MEQIDIDDYETAFLALVNTDATCANHADLKTKVDTVEAERASAINKQNVFETNKNLIQMMQSNEYNKILEYGKLTKSFYDFDNAIKNSTIEAEREILVTEKQECKKNLKEQMNNDEFAVFLRDIIKFMINE